MSNIIQVKSSSVVGKLVKISSSSSSSSTNNDESDTSYIFSGSGEDDNEEDIIIKDNLNNKIKNNEDNDDEEEEEEYSNDFKKNACLIHKCGNKRKLIKLMEINKSLIRENKRLKIEEEKKENLFSTIKELQSYLNKLLPENNNKNKEEEEEVTCDEEN